MKSYDNPLNQGHWANVSEPIIKWTVLMAFLYVCMYVCMYSGHSVLCSIQNYMTTSIKWKLMLAAGFPASY